MSVEIKIRNAEEILEFREKLIDALKNQKTITDTDKQRAHGLLDKIQLLEWVLGSICPFDDFPHLMIDSNINNWFLENKQSKKFNGKTK
jgi:hypothetical protein